MLPYRLRPPQKKLKSASQTDVQAGGGPIQRAIQKDLVVLHQEFLADLERERQQQQQQQQQQNKSKEPETSKITTTATHWKQGLAFGIFKQVFGSYKVAIVHLLIPSSKCDDEAYIQLIYAACFDVLKASMTSAESDTSLSFDTSIAAIFSLYAFYQTNPLPRTTATPMENLPMDLHSSENPRGMYRRAFKQNIRIDRQHYNLLLRLRELALARQAECNHSYYCQQQQKEAQWTCTCGIARDGLDVLDRLQSNLDFVDYTGPVGLEGLAGHSDWGWKDNDNFTEPSTGLSSLDVPQEEPFDHSISFLKTNLQTYQSRIKAIQLPTEKSRLSARLRDALSPFYASLQKEPWEQVHDRLFRDHPSNPENASRQVEIRRVLQVRTETTKQDMGDDRHVVLTEEDAVNKEETLPSFELVMTDGIPEYMQNHVEKAVTCLLEQDKDLLTDVIAADAKSNLEDTPRDSSKAIQDYDDVSSIGIGGVSVATGHGRMALQNLLSSNAKLPRVATIPKPTKTQLQRPIQSQQKNPSALFLSLTEDNIIDSSSNDDSDDDGSDVSNLSEDDGNDDGDASAATSAVGRHALEALLNKVQAGPKKRDRKKRVTDTINRKRRISSMEHQSTTSSIGPGKAALDALLTKAASRVMKTQKRKVASTKKKSTQPNDRAQQEKANQNDEHSTASSSRPGKAALDALLSQVEEKPSSSRVRKKRPRSNGHQPRIQSARDAENEPTLEKPTPEDQFNLCGDENQSTSSSIGPGKLALAALLNRASQRSSSRLKKPPVSSATHHEDHNDSSGNQSLASSVGPGKAALEALLKTTARKSPQKKPPNDSGDNQSLASSVGPGAAALGALLKTTARKSPLKEKPPHDSGDNQSLASTVGPGAAALEALLKTTSRKAPLQEKPPHDSGDNQSLASSVGPGTAALEALLKTAARQSPRKKKPPPN